jgi:nitrogen fixation protein FixH
MAKPFTGYHMAAILAGFFGVVIGVNLVMATFATRTFGGVVVENSYVASQKFNAWLGEERAQEKFGWNPQLGVDRTRRVTLSLRVADALVRGRAEHPLGRQPDVALAFTAAHGAYRSVRPLPPGRWNVRLLVRHGGRDMRLAETLS